MRAAPVPIDVSSQQIVLSREVPSLKLNRCARYMRCPSNGHGRRLRKSQRKAAQRHNARFCFSCGLLSYLVEASGRYCRAPFLWESHASLVSVIAPQSDVKLFLVAGQANTPLKSNLVASGSNSIAALILTLKITVCELDPRFRRSLRGNCV